MTYREQAEVPEYPPEPAPAPESWVVAPTAAELTLNKLRKTAKRWRVASIISAAVTCLAFMAVTAAHFSWANVFCTVMWGLTALLHIYTWARLEP